jgi:ABC-type lipoprotein export system ATPase subunit
MLRFENVSKWFKGPNSRVYALKNISFSVSPKELLVIRGPSGCGKTTLLLTAGALLNPDEGTVELADRNPYQLSPENRSHLRAQTIGFVFQQFHLIPYLTVKENILSAGLALKDASYVDRVGQLLEQFQLDHRTDHLPGQLSTGEKQRTALARALLRKPAIIMADEPTGNLDNNNAKIIYNYFQQFAKQGGCVLLVTHDDAADAYATRRLLLQDGELLPTKTS